MDCAATRRISSRALLAASNAEPPCTRVLLLPRTPVSLITLFESNISTPMASSGTFSSSPTICRIIVKTQGDSKVTLDKDCARRLVRSHGTTDPF